MEIGVPTRVVVLGGSGYLGARLCWQLADRGAQVASVSRRGHYGIDLTTASGVRRLHDLLDQARPDVVVNAVERDEPASATELVRSNVELVQRLVAAVGDQRRPPRLIHLGSMAEYGPTRPPSAGGADGADETCEPAPTDAYGATKLAATRTVLEASEDLALDAVVLRAASLIGGGSPAGRLLWRTADQLEGAALSHSLGGRAAPLRFGSLQEWSDFVDADDLARAVLRVIEAPADEVRGEVFNVGSGVAVQVRTLIDAMVAQSGLEIPVLETEPIAPAEAAWHQLDVSKAQRVLSWKPETDLRASLSGLLNASGLRFAA